MDKHNSDLRSVDLPLSTVDVGNSLAEVELSLLLSGNTLDLEQRGVGSGVSLSSLVSGDSGLGVKSSGSQDC